MSPPIKIADEHCLLEKLFADISSCNKQKVLFIAGHFPLFYEPEGAIEATHYWGEFSTYSLELACRLGQYARKHSKEVQFAFIVDDHSYENFNLLGILKVKRRRNRFYQEKSWPSAQLPAEYQTITHQYEFSEANVLRHDHHKNGRRDCLYFSEKVLRAAANGIENPCAREYVEFIEKQIDKQNTFLVAFIPNRCQNHICDLALDEHISGLSASHVFMETMLPLATREELYTKGRGVTYRKD